MLEERLATILKLNGSPARAQTNCIERLWCKLQKLTFTCCIHSMDESTLVMQGTWAAAASYVLPPAPNSK